jgi:hypothetical protein
VNLAALPAVELSIKEGPGKEIKKERGRERKRERERERERKIEKEKERVREKERKRKRRNREREKSGICWMMLLPSSTYSSASCRGGRE